MKTNTMTAVALLTTLAGSSAYAQERSKDEAKAESSAQEAVTTNAVEIGVAAGYSQGFGDVSTGRASLADTAQAGGAVEIDFGYRFSPHFMLGVYGAGSQFVKADSLPDGTKVYAAAAGVQANWHFLPTGQFDPWVGLGTGWRGYWISDDQGTTARHGLDLARVQAGVDYRLDPHVSITPVIGASLSTLLTESAVGQETFHTISSPDLNTFLFAGVMGRFDFGVGTGAGSAVASR